MQLPAESIIDSWPAANLINPVRRGPENTIINCVLLPLTCITVMLRVYTRLRISKNWGADDWLLVLGLVPIVAYSTLNLLCDFSYGWRHIWDLPVSALVAGLKITLASQMLFLAGSTLTQMSILMLIRRLLSVTRGRTYKFITIIALVTGAQGLGFMLLILFHCNNISDYWAFSYMPEKCLTESTVVLVAGTANTFFTPFLLPLVLSSKHRKTMLLLFGFGVLIVLIGTARTYYQVKAASSWDKAWASYPVWLACSVELFIGMIVASIPTLEPLLHFLFPEYGSTTRIHTSEPKARRSLPLMVPSQTFQLFDPVIPTPDVSNDVASGLSTIPEMSSTKSPAVENFESLSSHHKFRLSHSSSISSFNITPPDPVYTTPSPIQITTIPEDRVTSLPSTDRRSIPAFVMAIKEADMDTIYSGLRSSYHSRTETDEGHVSEMANGPPSRRSSHSSTIWDFKKKQTLSFLKHDAFEWESENSTSSPRMSRASRESRGASSLIQAIRKVTDLPNF